MHLCPHSHLVKELHCKEKEKILVWDNRFCGLAVVCSTQRKTQCPVVWNVFLTDCYLVNKISNVKNPAQHVGLVESRIHIHLTMTCPRPEYSFNMHLDVTLFFNFVIILNLDSIGSIFSKFTKWNVFTIIIMWMYPNCNYFD